MQFWEKLYECHSETNKGPFYLNTQTAGVNRQVTLFEVNLCGFSTPVIEYNSLSWTQGGIIYHFTNIQVKYVQQWTSVTLSKKVHFLDQAHKVT